MPRPELPPSIGKKGVITDIDGNKQCFTVIDEIRREQSTYTDKVICLQQLQFEDDGRIELRLAYYIIGKKPGKTKGKWVWGQFATMMPIEDFRAIVHEATRKGWI